MKARPYRKALLIALVCGLVLLAVGVAAGRHLGTWLVASDPLTHADAIFVTDGGQPRREAEAAVLYRDGWAPRVAVTLARSDISDEVRRLTGEPTPQEATARILLRAGVPEGAILRLDRLVENTQQELQADFDYARAHGFRRIIIVSSPYHTRRIRVIWNTRYEQDIAAIVRPTRYESTEPSRWWRSRRSLENVLHEVFGIAHFFLGSPIPTFDRND